MGQGLTRLGAMSDTARLMLIFGLSPALTDKAQGIWPNEPGC